MAASRATLRRSRHPPLKAMMLGKLGCAATRHRLTNPCSKASFSVYTPPGSRRGDRSGYREHEPQLHSAAERASAEAPEDEQSVHSTRIPDASRSRPMFGVAALELSWHWARAGRDVYAGNHRRVTCDLRPLR